MADTTKTILLVADISGFTQFVRMHPLANSHSRMIIVHLLNSIVQSTRLPLLVAELEGDAVFLYATAQNGDIAEVAEQVKEQIPRMFRAFERERDDLMKRPPCECDACTSISNLRLKQVVHAGDVAFEKIDRFEKLLGLDVIVVHRMLKNSVPAKEYLMLSDPAYSTFRGFYDQEPEHRVEQYDDVGPVNTVVFYEPHLRQVLERLVEEEPVAAH
jgi:Protein of unknown function (DUF2652)